VLARAIRRGILLAVSAGLIAVPTAAAVTYPTEDGNGFDGDAQGWSGTVATCNPNVGGLCTESNFFSGSQGNPPGSIESQMTVFANAGDLFISCLYDTRINESSNYRVGLGGIYRKNEFEGSALLPCVSLHFYRFSLNASYEVDVSRRTASQRGAFEVGLIYVGVRPPEK